MELFVSLISSRKRTMGLRDVTSIARQYWQNRICFYSRVSISLSERMEIRSTFVSFNVNATSVNRRAKFIVAKRKWTERETTTSREAIEYTDGFKRAEMSVGVRYCKVHSPTFGSFLLCAPANWEFSAYLHSFVLSFGRNYVTAFQTVCSFGSRCDMLHTRLRQTISFQFRWSAPQKLR